MSQAGILDVESANPQIPTSFITDDGPATPILNEIELLGEVVPNAGIPFQSTGSGNVVTYQIQYADETAASDATKVGVAAFDSSSFSVDANGFVSLLGGGGAVTSFDVQSSTAPGTDPVVPTVGGAVTINGAAVVNHSVVLESHSRAANEYNLEVQYATSSAISDETKSGVAHFDSTDFSVSPAGFVALSGTGAGQTITGDTGGALSPTAGNWNLLGSGSITTAGAGSTLTTQLTGLTNHNVLIGAGTTTITKVAPSATSGVALISQGAAADPAFGTVVVAGGGTGATTLTGVLTGNGTSAVTANAITQYAVVIGGAANAVASTAVGSAGQVLQSSGAGVNPAYSTATYPLTTTVSQILYSSATNTVTGLATANRAVVTTTSTGVPVVTALATDGQLIIGSTAGAPAAATLTAGTGISITNGSNAITINSTGGLTWSEETASPVSAAVNHGYIANLGSLLTFNLPGTFAVGDIIHIVGKGAGLWVIDAPAGDTIQFGNQVTSSGGTITATNAFDCIQIIGTTANSAWTCTGVAQGNLTVA